MLGLTSGFVQNCQNVTIVLPDDDLPHDSIIVVTKISVAASANLAQFLTLCMSDIKRPKSVTVN